MSEDYDYADDGVDAVEAEYTEYMAGVDTDTDATSHTYSDKHQVAQVLRATERAIYCRITGVPGEYWLPRSQLKGKLISHWILQQKGLDVPSEWTEEDRAEAVGEMTERACRRQCALCGQALPHDVVRVLGRICPACLPPASAPAVAMARRLGLSYPCAGCGRWMPPASKVTRCEPCERASFGGRKVKRVVSAPQSSYWVITKGIEPYGLVYEVAHGRRRR